MASDKTTKLLNKMRKREQVTQKLTPIGSEIIMPNLSGLKAAAARQGLGLQEVCDIDNNVETTNDDAIVVSNSYDGNPMIKLRVRGAGNDGRGELIIYSSNDQNRVNIQGDSAGLIAAGLKMGPAGQDISSETIDNSALCEIESTSKGFLPPRMTTAQKNAISSPATGLVVYDTTLNKLCVYTGAAWETVTSA